MASLQDGVQNLEVWRVGMKMLNLVTQMKDPEAPLFTVKFPVLKQKVLLRFGFVVGWPVKSCLNHIIATWIRPRVPRKSPMTNDRSCNLTLL